MRAVMRLSGRERDLHHLHPDDLKPFLFQPVQNLSAQAPLNGVGLQNDQRFFHSFHPQKVNRFIYPTESNAAKQKRSAALLAANPRYFTAPSKICRIQGIARDVDAALDLVLPGPAT